MAFDLNYLQYQNQISDPNTYLHKQYQRKNAEALYGMKIPEYQSPEDRFFSAMSKYTGGGATAGGTPSTAPGYYENRLRSLLENPESVSQTSGYKFAFNEGQRALERSAAAKGMLGSGNTLAALVQYGQGQAAQQYGNEANRLADLFKTEQSGALERERARIAADQARTQNMATMFEMYNKQPKFMIA